MLEIVILLGIVEGLTEFLPVSSTGHLILVGHWLGYEGEAADIFIVVIQIGAILAVVLEYRKQLFGHLFTLGGSRASRRYYLNILVAFLPAAVLGFLLHDALFKYLFTPQIVALAMIIGAALIYLVEWLHLQPRTSQVEELSFGQSLGVGFAQCAALFPGFSRSAATILGGLVCGLDRPTAARFSFLLAIPTIVGAGVLELAQNSDRLLPQDRVWVAVGFVVAFVSAWAAVRWFLSFVSRHTLRVFAAYRLAVGLAVLFFAPS